MIPTPRFFVLYNGEQKIQNQVMKLSDSFVINDAAPSLELIANVIDINYGSGTSVFAQSLSLSGYSRLISEIRRGIHLGKSRDEAISLAIESCISQGILKDFLEEHYLEVSKMLNYEYDAEAEKRVLRQEGRREGLQEGLQQGVEQGLQKGRQESAISIAQKLLVSQIPIDLIIQATGLTREDIERLLPES
jgi:predicted transposase/invertase (TIGR01784 family)